jgi:hypothetical protein
MPNPIKYSTGSETLALKKGNFYIGTGAVGKGPTSETGYYNGITPPSGGYTIYLNKETGGPSIYTASNDAQLISLTNSIAGQSYTGVQQCFDYYYGQTDKVLVNQDYPVDYPYIVMDGLVLYLDAGITQSYPGSGTVWTDVNGLGPKNNGTLTNGPTFSSSDGGSIVFDGVDDFMEGNDNGLFNFGTGDFTTDVWVKLNTLQSGYRSIFARGNPNGGSRRWWYLAKYQTGNKFLFAVDDDILKKEVISNTVAQAGVWYHITGVRKSGNRDEIYINGVFETSQTDDGNSLDANEGDRLFRFAAHRVVAGPYEFCDCSIGGGKIYNRALSDSEVLQNYNAQKGRFGL